MVERVGVDDVETAAGLEGGRGGVAFAPPDGREAPLPGARVEVGAAQRDEPGIPTPIRLRAT
ncbi:hypothetical protein Srut_39360 [Streptomyces rutgersensis]|nr:hypothetical protein Srut_39360 [Streptomyces rutgersensis]